MEKSDRPAYVRRPRGTYAIDTRHFQAAGLSFRPTEPTLVVGKNVEKLKYKPGSATTTPVLGARLFVGLTACSIDDVVAITRRVRTRQTGEDGPFMLSRGLVKRGSSGIPEDGVQVVIVEWDLVTQDEFRARIVELGESLVRDLQQAVVYVDMQRNGLTIAILAVTA